MKIRRHTAAEGSNVLAMGLALHVALVTGQYLNTCLVRERSECESPDDSLGVHDTLALCAAQCARTNGCTFFIYRHPLYDESGNCLREATTSAACPEGFRSAPSYDFYELTNSSCPPRPSPPPPPFPYPPGTIVEHGWTPSPPPAGVCDGRKVEVFGFAMFMLGFIAGPLTLAGCFYGYQSYRTRHNLRTMEFKATNMTVNIPEHHEIGRQHGRHETADL